MYAIQIWIHWILHTLRTPTSWRPSDRLVRWNEGYHSSEIRRLCCVIVSFIDIRENRSEIKIVNAFRISDTEVSSVGTINLFWQFNADTMWVIEVERSNSDMKFMLWTSNKLPILPKIFQPSDVVLVLPFFNIACDRVYLLFSDHASSCYRGQSIFLRATFVLFAWAQDEIRSTDK